MSEDKIDYNKEPVCYCRHCLSLNIIDSGSYAPAYCHDCGSTDNRETDIYTWRKLYYRRYGKLLTNYTDKSR